MRKGGVALSRGQVWILAGSLVVGCGTSSVSSSPGDAGSVSTAATPPPAPTPPPPADAGLDARDADADAEVAEASTCPVPGPSAASALPWKSPKPVQAGACTEADVLAIDQYLLTTPEATKQDLETFILGRGQACHDCAFGQADAGTWSPLQRTATSYFANVGGCFALLSGRDGCGKAIQNEYDCEQVACAACRDASLVADPDASPCTKLTQSTTCKDYVMAIASAAGCMGVSPTVDDACGTVTKSIRVQCVGP
jgi:hypothetical protein